MKIGVSYDLKQDLAAEANLPEDAFEEYDSVETIDALSVAIASQGHEVLRLGGGRGFLEKILTERPDFVFNISEGLGNFRSREAQVPSVLEMLGIPYSGSDPLTLAISLEKPLTKEIVRNAGVVTPRWRVINSLSDMDNLSAQSAAPTKVGTDEFGHPSLITMGIPLGLEHSWQYRPKDRQRGKRNDRNG